MELEKFINAHRRSYDRALAEIKNGCKESHWMWFIFPQIAGLGQSSMAQFYAIVDAKEAATYLKDEILGSHLIEICETLLALPSSDAHEIFGSPDDLKLRSSMTLFNETRASPVFGQVLDKFFKGKKDERTLNILRK